MKNRFKMLIFAVIFNAGFLNAQTILQPENLPELPSLLFNINNTVFISSQIGHPFQPEYFLPIDSNNTNFSVFRKIYPNSKLAFFCRVEVELEKTVSFPVKLRLGDVDYVDRLEGK